MVNSVVFPAESEFCRIILSKGPKLLSVKILLVHCIPLTLVLLAFSFDFLELQQSLLLQQYGVAQHCMEQMHQASLFHLAIA